LKGRKPQTCDVWKVIIIFFEFENYERKVREIKRKQTTMDEDQKSVFNLAINGHNLLITGQGGTGKSCLFQNKKYINLKE
jgi:DNA replication protein DnaC